MEFPVTTSFELAKKYCLSFLDDILENIPDGKEAIAIVGLSFDGTCKAKGFREPEDGENMIIVSPEGSEVEVDSVIMNLNNLLFALATYDAYSSTYYEGRKDSNMQKYFSEVVKEFSDFLGNEDEITQGGQEAKEKAKVILNKLP